MIAPSPIAADTDHNQEPVVIPAAIAKPLRRPLLIEAPAIASVAGPGLAVEINAANIINGRLT